MTNTKTHLALLTQFNLRLRKVIVYRVTVIKFAVNSARDNVLCCLQLQIQIHDLNNSKPRSS